MAKDFLDDSTLDDLITDGDYSVGVSDYQHVNDIIISAPGSWREYPTCGVGVTEYQSSSGQKQTIERMINQQLSNDGCQNIFINITESPTGATFNVNGEYL